VPKGKVVPEQRGNDLPPVEVVVDVEALGRSLKV